MLKTSHLFAVTPLKQAHWF